MANAYINTLDIVSATYGGSDFTSLLLKRHGDFVASAGPFETAWKFTVNSEFFLTDPNIGVQKCAVVCYRYYLDASGAYSSFFTTAAVEGSIMTISQPVASLTAHQDPQPDPTTNEYIISAHWGPADVTAQVVRQFTTAVHDPNKGTTIVVAQDGLIPDPMQGTPKQLGVVFARYVNGQWYYCTAVDLRADVSWPLTISPAFPAAGQRCLQIYSATWGGACYTDFVRDLYVRDWIAKSSSRSNTSNSFSITPSEATLGPDPNVSTKKAFVLIYRMASYMGTKDGFTTDPSAPPVWTEAWFKNKPPMLQTSSYPVMADFSVFQVATVLDGQTLTVDLTAADITPLEKPIIKHPWIMKAMWGTADVTTSVGNQIYFQAAANNFQMGHTAPSGKPATTGVGPAAGYQVAVTASELQAADPMPNVHKQLTLLVGYPLVAAVGYEVHTIVQMYDDGNPIVNVPLYPVSEVQSPVPWAPKQVRRVKFINHGVLHAWPQVFQDGHLKWCPRPSAAQQWDPTYTDKWLIIIGDSETIDLIDDAGCKPGALCTVNLNCEITSDTAQSPQFQVSGDTNDVLTVLQPLNMGSVYAWARVGQVAFQVAKFLFGCLEAE